MTQEPSDSEKNSNPEPIVENNRNKAPINLSLLPNGDSSSLVGVLILLYKPVSYTMLTP